MIRKAKKMAKRKGVKPKVTLMNDIAAIQPIPRGRDNTDDLELAEQMVHTAMGHATARGAGTFQPAGGLDSFNNKKVTAPPYKSG